MMWGRLSQLLQFSLVVTAALLLSSCSTVGGHEAGVIHHIREHRGPNNNGGARIDSLLENDNLITVSIKGHEFAVRSRQPELAQFPCQRCHKGPLAQMKHNGKDGKPRAHWNLKLEHADEQVMSCSTCHLENDLNQLRTLANKPVSIDGSHQVCAQCHSKQAADWAGGAHGKRVGGWAPPRVVKTCVECHNPHGPAWDHRYPARVAKREDRSGHE